MLATRLAHKGADGEIGNVVVVHDVEVHDAGARLEHVIDFFAQTRKVRRQYRRRYQIFWQIFRHAHS